MTAFERHAVLDQLKIRGADIEHVPIVTLSTKVTEVAQSIDELLEYAEGPSLNPETKREGVVFKSLNSDFTFKAISNSYLLKHKDR
jgi:hypothetical protein